MFVLHFGSPEIRLETAGGKGLNLARLARAGFNVPRGFIISTDAYRAFVAANRWLAGIGSTVENIAADDLAALEKNLRPDPGVILGGRDASRSRLCHPRCL